MVVTINTNIFSYCYRSMHQPLMCLVGGYQHLSDSVLIRLTFWAEAWAWANGHLFFHFACLL